MIITAILKSLLVGLLMLLAIALLVIGALFFLSFVSGLLGVTPVHQWTNQKAKNLFKRLILTLQFKTGK